MSEEVRAAALSWAGAGFCVLPTKHHDKAPMVSTWKQYVQAKGSNVVPAPPSLQIVDRWFAGEQSGLGLILGATSGNAEMFEFEGRAITEGLYQDFGAFAETNGAGNVWAKLKAGYVERTPSGGLHFVFRVNGKAMPNTRLAARPSNAAELALYPDQPIQVLIETRGEGGFVVIAPSTMPGKAWVQTGLGQIVTLSTDERDALYDVARMFDSVPEYVRKEIVAREKADGVLTPLDDFRARTDWADILEPAGWTHVGMKLDGRDAWLRPGKDFSEGWGLSATTGNTDGKSDSLYVFSTSTDLPTLQGLSKEFVWAHYNVEGDMREAVRALADDGYGDDSNRHSSRVVPGDINPFSEGFDPDAWAKARAQRETATVPTAPASGLSEGGRTDEQGASPSLEFRALDFAALDAEDYIQEWIVEGFLPKAAAVALYSASGLGKSLLMQEMAAQVSQGADFMGKATAKTVVLYVDHENGPRTTIWPRLKAMGFKPADLDGLRILSFPDMETLDTPAGAAALKRAVAQFDAGLVIIDTVSRTIKGEENNNDTWLAFHKNTGRWLKKAEIAYVRLDHSGKDETKGQRGGSAKTGDVDIIWQLCGTGSGRFSLRVEKDRDDCLPATGVIFKRERSPLRSVTETAQTMGALGGGMGALSGGAESGLQARTDKAQRLEEILKVSGTALVKTRLRDMVGGKQAVVNDILDRLTERKFLLCDVDGKYSWNVDKPVDNPFE